MTKKGNVAVLIFLLIPVAGIFKWFDYRHKLETGYCFSEKRYLSNQELTEHAIEGLLENLKANYESLSIEERSNVLRYDSVDDFIDLNPIASEFKFMSNPKDSEFWEARMEATKKGGFLSAYGFQIYAGFTYQYAKSGETIYRRYGSVMSYCGKVRGGSAAFRIGEPVSTLPETYPNR